MSKSKIALTAGVVAAVALVGPASSGAGDTSSRTQPSVHEAFQLAQAKGERPVPTVIPKTLRVPAGVKLGGNLDRPVSRAALNFIESLADSVAKAPTDFGQAAGFGEISYKYALKPGDMPTREITIR